MISKYNVGDFVYLKDKKDPVWDKYKGQDFYFQLIALSGKCYKIDSVIKFSYRFAGFGWSEIEIDDTKTAIKLRKDKLKRLNIKFI